jgi:hypothetical protein
MTLKLAYASLKKDGPIGGRMNWLVSLAVVSNRRHLEICAFRAGF